MSDIHPIDKFREAFESETSGNRRPVIDEPANDFEKAINAWAELQELQEAVKAAMKALNAEEKSARDAIASSLKPWFEDQGKLKEGVNDYPLSNGRKLKFTHGIDRKISEPDLVVTRKEYAAAAAEGSDPAFDSLLRVKYELNVTPWRKLSTEAEKAFSRCVTSKDKSPTLAID